ncbi:ppsA, partial [Symbiodinium microadriaticum]
VESLVLEVARDVAGAVGVQAVEFRNRLSNELQGVKLPNTLIFDYPTVAAISNFAVAQLGPVADSMLETAGRSLDSGASASVQGLAATLPGRRDDGVWEDLLQKKDSVIEVPFARWEHDVYYSSDTEAPGKTYAQHGGFIEGAELFDPSIFALSMAEAAAIDPQQRLLLEAAQTAFQSAGREPEQLMESCVGVFVGQCQYDWFVMISAGDQFNPYTGTGMSASISANRISYVFGLKGRSLTCDTACSSSLVAADAALSSLRRRTAEGALAAGTNLILGPAPYIAFSQAKMLSKHGRCFTFDKSANGFARGEGVGCIFLSMADEETSRGPVGPSAARALIRGTAVNQDGRSASLTAPNGPCQQVAVRGALSEASASPSEVSLVECHGTGTALGDPIEVDALKTVLGNDSPVALGAAKTNIAHLEGSAGIAGLLKSVHMLEKRQVPSNLHFQSLNPHIDLEDFQAQIPLELYRLPGGTVVSGLSSFGFGGTNAHVTCCSTGRDSDQTASSITFRHASFPWRKTSYRCLRRKIAVGSTVQYECAIKADLFKVCAEHVVFNQIVVPGVVYVEHAMEAVKTIIGSDGYLEDLAMTWPLIIPKHTDEPTASAVFLRFCQMGDKFEMRSVRGESTEMMTHCEGRLGRGLAEPSTLDLEDMYEAIQKAGLWLGPRFQAGSDLTFTNQAMSQDAAAWLLRTGCASYMDVAFMWCDGADLFKVIQPCVVNRTTQNVAPSLRSKCCALFLLLYHHILDHNEIGFPALDLQDEHKVWEATQVVLACALRMSPDHVGGICAGLKRWLRFAGPQGFDVVRPHARELAAFLRQVSFGGPTAASSLFQMFKWLRTHLGVPFDIEHFLVKPYRLHAPGHVQKQREELQPWEFANMLICAASLTGCPRALASFCILAAAVCVRFRHLQRSTLVQDHGDWLEFKCSMGKSKKQGVRPPYHWALPEVCFEDFCLLAEVRPLVMAQLEAGATFLLPRPRLESEDLWQVVDSTPLEVGKPLSPSRFLEFFRGFLLRCGVDQSLIAHVGYNRLRRFLPTGGTTLGMDEVSLQAIGSWTEPVRTDDRSKRPKLMATHYAGNKMLNSLQAKREVVAAVMQAVKRHQGARYGEPSLLPAGSVIWKHVTRVAAASASAVTQPADIEPSNVSSSSFSTASSEPNTEGSDSEAGALPLDDLGGWSWFLQRAKAHIVQGRDESERPVPYCRQSAFPQDPTRVGDGLPPFDCAVCQRCLRSVPKSFRARLFESKGI